MSTSEQHPILAGSPPQLQDPVAVKAQLAALRRSVDAAQATLDQWTGFQTDYKALKATLVDLPARVSHQVMVPLGPLAFMPGKLVHTNEVTVLLGDNWFVERSAAQAADIVQRRMDCTSVSASLLCICRSFLTSCAWISRCRQTRRRAIHTVLAPIQTRLARPDASARTHRPSGPAARTQRRRITVYGHSRGRGQSHDSRQVDAAATVARVTRAAHVQREKSQREKVKQEEAAAAGRQKGSSDRPPGTCASSRGAICKDGQSRSIRRGPCGTRRHVWRLVP
ncbi:Prefoldin [Catenaria anguillulae PL171]|uniref:Prefoldin n=1 Tax=Catenaria anguillulae PL171 TaxID=765915 RepID=A0A1Y2HZF2_9FUNG|nr:Prefoldin [Catenaria anguillulae PL171]